MVPRVYSLLYIFMIISTAIAISPLKTDYEWKYFDYDWESPNQKQEFINSGRYDYRNLTPIDVDRSVDGRTFVTIIRTGGVPATLHTISDKCGESGALLQPYPDWSWYYNTTSCKGIINVYRVAIDKCNRIWVLDTGVIDDNHVCPAKLLIFNLQNNKLIKTIEIPNKIARNKSGIGLLITPILEVYGKNCQDVTVYMGDVTGYGLVVYDGKNLFRLEGDVFQSEQIYANITVAGESFYLPDGILGMALSPKSKSGNRYLFFRPLASRSLFAAKTNVLKRDYTGTQTIFTRAINVLPHQGSAMVFSSEGILFYGLTTEIALGCWNLNDPLTPEHFKIAIQDTQRLQFISGIKVIDSTLFFPEPVEQLIIMTNRIQKAFTGTMNFSEVNYRLLRGQVSDIIRGTPCQLR